MRNQRLMGEFIYENFKSSKPSKFEWKVAKEDYLNHLRKKHENFKNKIKLNTNFLKFKDEIEYLENLCYPPNDPANDNDDDDDKYKLERKSEKVCVKHVENLNLPNKPELSPSAILKQEIEINCFICNDGNAFVLDLCAVCSLCGVSVHYSCYGVKNNSKGENWYCDVCDKYRNLEIAENLECILCPVKGGAMKQCDVKINSTCFNKIMKLRMGDSCFESNPDLLKGDKIPTNTFTRTGASTLGKFPSVIKENLKLYHNSEISSNSTSHALNEDDNISLNSNYDPYAFKLKSSFYSEGDAMHLHTKNSCENSKLRMRPTKDEFAWVHMSCATWNKEIFVSKFKKEIKNVERIPEEKFKELCMICNLSNYGPVIKCFDRGCTFKFHVECARVNHYFMEINHYKLTLHFSKEKVTIKYFNLFRATILEILSILSIATIIALTNF